MLQKPVTDWHRLSDLQPHPIVQRRLIPARVKHLSNPFEPSEIGTLTVWLHDGKPYIIDGQHRWHAGMESGHADLKVKCDVYRNATLQEMARKFLFLNDSRFVSALDKFEISLEARDESAMAIAETVAKYNLHVGTNTTDGCVRCIDKLLKLHDRDPGLLDEVLRVTTETWGTRASAVEAVVIDALGRVLAHYNGQLDRKRLVKKLAKYRGGPTGLIGDARGLAAIKPYSVGRAAAEIVVDAYNVQLGDRGLPPL